MPDSCLANIENVTKVAFEATSFVKNANSEWSILTIFNISLLTTETQIGDDVKLNFLLFTSDHCCGLWGYSLLNTR